MALLFIFANSMPCASFRVTLFHIVNCVTAADVFQMLQISVCVICHSLSQFEEMSPFQGHLQARIQFQYYAHVHDMFIHVT